MRPIKTAIVFFCFLSLISMKGNTQIDLTSDNVQWNASPYFDSSQDSSFQVTSRFITYGTEKIRWIRFQDSQHKKPFKNILLTVMGIDGAWVDPETDGKIIYKFLYDNNPGTLTISRAGPVCTIILKWDKYPKEHQFNFEVSGYKRENF